MLLLLENVAFQTVRQSSKYNFPLCRFMSCSWLDFILDIVLFTFLEYWNPMQYIFTVENIMFLSVQIYSSRVLLECDQCPATDLGPLVGPSTFNRPLFCRTVFQTSPTFWVGVEGRATHLTNLLQLQYIVLFLNSLINLNYSHTIVGLTKILMNIRNLFMSDFWKLIFRYVDIQHSKKRKRINWITE